MKNIFHFLTVNIYHRILQLSFDNCFAEFQFFLKKNFTFSIVFLFHTSFFLKMIYSFRFYHSAFNYQFLLQFQNNKRHYQHNDNNKRTTNNKQTKLILIYNHVILVLFVVVRNKEILTHPQKIVYFDVRKSSRYIFCLARLRLVGYHSFCRFVFSFFFTS